MILLKNRWLRIEELDGAHRARHHISSRPHSRYFDALLRDLPETWTLRNEGEDTWSAFDVIGHLIHGERTDWMPKTRVVIQFGKTKTFERFDRLGDRGLVVAGFPANDFKSQEPGSNADIQSFCTTNYGVDFSLFEKITVVGEAKHPLYRELIAGSGKT